MEKKLRLHLLAMSKKLLYVAIIQCLSMSLLFAWNGNAQVKRIDQIRIGIGFNETGILHAFSEIEKRTGLNFVYSNKELDTNNVLTIGPQENLYEILAEMSRQTNLIFKQINHNIIVRKHDSDSMLDAGAILSQDDITVSGTVVDASNEPLPGVTVSLSGTTTGTATDLDGRYSLTVPEGSVLVFSFIGFETQRIEVGGRSVINVILNEDMASLDEVVVVGYGTQRKIETTGSIASVNADELTQTPITNIAQGIQARVPGVHITQNSGAPGGNISVRIRGTNSISGTSEPLYIVDGVQISNGGDIRSVSPLSTINPNDVASIEVLKDASSTAIYGARAANGVVLITTKRGRAGQTNVTFENYYGIQNVTKLLPVLNATQFAELENETFKDDIYPDPAALGEGVNYQKLIFREAPIHSHQLSVSGGSEKTQFAISANYFNQDGIIINSNFKRYAARLNLDHAINQTIKVGASILGSYNINTGIQTGVTNENVRSNILGAAISAPPTMEPYRPDGSIYPFGEQAEGRYREVFNPLGIAEVLDRTAINRTLANFYGEATFLSGLSYRASFNVDMGHSLNDYYSPRYIVSTNDLDERSGSGSKTNSHSTTLLHESVLTYARQLAEAHSIKFTGLFAAQTELGNSAVSSGTGFPNDATMNESLQLAMNYSVSSNRSKSQLISYMGRINYGYREKYLLDLTGRVDGSSKFGKNNKYGFFPAVSAAWRIITEPFMEDLNLFSDLKLRASYGITGNAGAISPYRSLNTVSASAGYQINHVYNTGINPSGIANPDLRWEKSTQGNIGLDLGFWQDRLSFVVDAYTKTTDDLLYIKSLPLSSGYPSITGNYASIENKGIELATRASLIEGDFNWDVSANFSINRNKVLTLDGGTTAERFITTYTILKEGEPLGSFKTYRFEGIIQSEEDILPGYDGRVGGHKIRDVNRDGTISSEDQVITGNPNPKYIFGFSTNFYFKNFDLSAFLSGVQGNDIFNFSRYRFENPFGLQNLLKVMEDRWSPSNPSNKYASAFQGGRLPVSDTFIEDGSYLRLKNITLGYTVPSIKGIRNLRVYLSGNNLLTITGYSGFDPEVNSYGGSNTTIGVDNTVYPQARSIIVGAQLSF